MDGGSQVNSQSQSGTANFNSSGLPKKWGHGSHENPDDHLKIKPIASAHAKLEKEAQVDVEAEKGSNAQGQAQIVQSDHNVLWPSAEFDVEKDVD